MGRSAFEPIRTERLLIRPFEPGDVDDMWRRHNHPDVARYQDWDFPRPRDQVERLVADIVAMDGPVDGEWWMAVVAEPGTGERLGDVGTQLSHGGRVAELGYSLWPQHWGRGYAVEAVGALVHYLFEDLGAARVFGMLHPDNPASAQVLERCGLDFEGHTRLSYWRGGEGSDDWIYGTTRAGWDDWLARPQGPPAAVRLVEITEATATDVLRLRTHESQKRFVAPMAASFADALFPEVVDGAQVVPWLRAVEADGDLAGFVMLALTAEGTAEPFLWRLLIDRRHQRRGIGRQVLDLVAAECRALGAGSLLTSWSEGRGSPRPFYLGAGFVPTGEVDHGETVARLQFG